LISTNREQLWVGSLQEDIDVRLVLEEWDEAPPPCGDAWDEEAKSTIYLRGQLSITMGLAGAAVRGLRLAGGVGDYSVRVYAGNRDQVTRRYAELFHRHRNPLSDDFQQEKKTLEGLERYLVQLWRESLPAAGYGPSADGAVWPAVLPLAPCALPVAALRPGAGAADLSDDLMLVAALTPALARAVVGGVLCGWPVEVTLAGDTAAGVVEGRGVCARNGIIA